MNIMSKLALRQMKKNKRRTLVTIIGAIVSVAMITAVSTFAGSFMGFFQDMAIENKGNWEISLEGIKTSDVEAVLEEYEYSGLRKTLSLGTRIFDGNVAGKRAVEIFAINADGMDDANISLIEGEMPHNSRELVVPEALAESLPQQYQIGKTVTLDLVKRFDPEENKPRDYSNPVTADEILQEAGQRAFTITGIVTTGIYDNSWYSGFCGFTDLDKSLLAETNFVDLAVKLTDPDKSLYEVTDMVSQKYTPTKVEYNTELLFYEGISNNHQLMTTFYLVGGILTIIIMVGSIALIYNAFSISINERGKQFGMLASIGATNRQKRNSVFMEAAFISLAAIPIGVGTGLLGIGITFRAIAPLWTSILNNVSSELHLIVLPEAIITAVIVSLLTIFLSAWVPARRAAKCSPIEAIRHSKDITLSQKTVKTRGITKKLFGFEGEIALKNLKRNRKKYFTTLISLVVSLVLFLTASAFTYYLSKSYNMTLENIDCDVLTETNGAESMELAKKMFTEMGAVPQLDSFVWDFGTDFEVNLPADNINDDVADIYRSIYGEETVIPGETVPFKMMLHGIDGPSMERFAKEQGVNYALLEDPEHPTAIVTDTFIYNQASNYQDVTVLDGATDSISGKLFYGDENTITYDSEEFSINVAKCTDCAPYGGEKKGDSIEIVDIYLDMKVFEAVISKYSFGDAEIMKAGAAKGSDSGAIAEAFMEIAQKAEYEACDAMVVDIQDYMDRQDNFLLIIDVFVYGFVTLIAVIGIANIFNTISTSLTLRKREFAILKSVGMSESAFRRMINFESFFYGMKAILYGVPLGLIIMYAMHQSLARNFMTEFSIPWGNVIGGAIAIMLIVFATMLYSGRKLKDDHIAEVLQNDNI